MIKMKVNFCNIFNKNKILAKIVKPNALYTSESYFKRFNFILSEKIRAILNFCKRKT